MMNRWKNVTMSFALTVCTVWTEVIIAEDYYVAPLKPLNENTRDQGDSAWKRATNKETPCSAKTAMVHAVAGDTVYFRGGKYNLDTKSMPSFGDKGYHAILQPSNSGTAQKPIVFKAFPGEIPILNGIRKSIISGTADAGTNNSTLVDNDVDFISAGIKNWYIFRTIEKKGGAAVDSVNKHKIFFLKHSHNNNKNLSPGDRYEISAKFITTPIGVWRENYITIDGFKVISNNQQDQARIIISAHNKDKKALGLVIKNCDIYGGTRRIVHGDNREGVRVEKTDGAIVSNCRVYGFKSIGDNHNTSAFKTYDNDNFLFENNEIYDCSYGFYIKRKTNIGVIRNNFITNCIGGMLITSYISVKYSSERNISIYNNLITYCKSSSIGDIVQETSDSDNMKIYNNTIYSGDEKSISISLGPGRKYFYNNIVVGRPLNYDVPNIRFKQTLPKVPLKVMECDYNIYNAMNTPKGFLIRFLKRDADSKWNSAYYTLEQWRQSKKLFDGNNPGKHSMLAMPKFVNTSGTLNQINDFALSKESPGKGAGKNGADIGANVKDVGTKRP